MNKIPQPAVPTLPGELAVSGNAITTLVGSSVVQLASGNMLSQAETDAAYFTPDIMPFTRVGDNSYLPMDIKADFRGAIQPWSQLPYVLVEADGSVSGLRAGYNGEYICIFYAYSTSGDVNTVDFKLTDSEYRPLWLAADEYVTAIVDSSTNGFLINIKSKTTLSLDRYFWVDHNNTLDSRFHTYLDVTTNMTIVPSGYTAAGPVQLGLAYYSGGGGTYIREANLWVQVHNDRLNKLAYSWYTVNRGFQSTYSSSNAAAFPAKSVNWQDVSATLSGTSNLSVIMDGSGSNFSKFFKIINGPGTPVQTYAVYPNAGRSGITYAYNSTTGTVRLLTTGIIYVQFSSIGFQAAWTTTMDYIVSANTLRYNPVTTDQVNYQQLPWVINFANQSAVDMSAVPSPITDAYKANKLPLVTFGQTGRGLVVGNQVNKVLPTGDRLFALSVTSTATTGFSMASSDLNAYTGSTYALKYADVLSRPFYTKDFPALSSYVAYDASILSKSLLYASFVGSNNIVVNTAARLYGQNLTSRYVNASLPSSDVSGTLYSADTNTQRPSLPIPNSVAVAGGRHNRPGLNSIIRATVPTMQVNQASLSDIDTYASTWLAEALDPVTGVPAKTYAADPTTFNAKAAEIAAAVQAASTLKPTVATTSKYDMQPFFIDSTAGLAYFVFSLVWGNITDGYQHEHGIVRLSLVGSTVVWPATATSALLSTVSSYKLTNASNVANSTQVFPDYASSGAYQKSDGSWFVLVQSATFIGVVGGNYSDTCWLKLNTSFSVTASGNYAKPATWLGYRVGVHPTYGPYASNTWQDSNAKASMAFKDRRSTTNQTTRLDACVDAWVSGVADTNVLILSSKSAAGFILYSSEIQVLMNGKVGIIPTQAIMLNTIAADPANKSFLFYVQWDGTQFVLKGSLIAIPESSTSTYVGTVTTNSTGIALSTIQKVSRIDTYRIENDAPIVGSAIRLIPNVELPEIQAYVYDSTDEVNAFKASHVPPSQADVFNSWDRTNSVSAYFPNGKGATGDAAAWTFATNPDRVVQPNNTSNDVSFVSPDSYSNYDFETTLYSPGTDDDAIGVVAAFARSNNTNIQLNVWRTCGGIGSANQPASGSTFDFAFIATGVALTAAEQALMTSKAIEPSRSNGNSGSGWNGSYTRVRVSRRGNIITAKCSKFSTSLSNVPLLESSTMTLDLTAVPSLAPLLDSAKYGYTTISQAGATFYNADFSGGLDASRVIDLQTNQVWSYNFGTSAWETKAITPQDELQYVRHVTNPITGNQYLVTASGVTKQ